MEVCEKNYRSDQNQSLVERRSIKRVRKMAELAKATALLAQRDSERTGVIEDAKRIQVSESDQSHATSYITFHRNMSMVDSLVFSNSMFSKSILFLKDLH